jgi:Ohr subfamily peroxiredoxin
VELSAARLPLLPSAFVKVLYTAEVTATGGRQGRVRSSDGALVLDLVTPKELGGPGGVATNPEQLFAAGYAACFENAVRRVARERKVFVGDASVTARVGIGRGTGTRFELCVELHVRLPEQDAEEAEQLARTAHEICPYSNATRNNIDVQIVIDPAPEVV